MAETRERQEKGDGKREAGSAGEKREKRTKRKEKGS
jgi:hypothetical protein